LIIKDNLTPRGRHEIQPSRFSAVMLKPIGGYMAEGETWMSAAEKHTREYFFGPRERAPRPPAPPVSATCEYCRRSYLVVHQSLARFCGSTCRKRAWRARTGRH
jgi:hypothetical protein